MYLKIDERGLMKTAPFSHSNFGAVRNGRNLKLTLNVRGSRKGGADGLTDTGGGRARCIWADGRVDKTYIGRKTFGDRLPRKVSVHP